MPSRVHVQLVHRRGTATFELRLRHWDADHVLEAALVFLRPLHVLHNLGSLVPLATPGAPNVLHRRLANLPSSRPVPAKIESGRGSDENSPYSSSDATRDGRDVGAARLRRTG